MYACIVVAQLSPTCPSDISSELEEFVVIGMYANYPQSLRDHIWGSVMKEYDEPIILIGDLNMVELEEDRVQ